MTTSTYDGNKPAHEIEEDVEATRTRIGSRLRELGGMLEPRRLIDKGTQALSTALPAQQARWEQWIRANASTLALVSAAMVVLLGRPRQDRLDGIDAAPEIPPPEAKMEASPEWEVARMPDGSLAAELDPI